MKSYSNVLFRKLATGIGKMSDFVGDPIKFIYLALMTFFFQNESINIHLIWMLFCGLSSHNLFKGVKQEICTEN